MSRLISTHALIVLIGGTLIAAATVKAQTTWHVDDDASVGGDGTGWPTAFKYLQDALALAGAGDEVRVAGGIYKPDQDEGGNVTPGDREAAFQLMSGVGLYGGYAGLADPNDPNARDIQLYETILSGDLSGDDDPNHPNTTSENSYHVVSSTETDSTAVIDGFTIRAGRADGSPPHDDGAGFKITRGSPRISYCTFTDNYASADGGGAFYKGDGADVFLTACTFTNNYAGDDGGGM